MRLLLVALALTLNLVVGGAPLHAQTSDDPSTPAPSGTATLAPSTKAATVALGHEPDRLYNPDTLTGQLVANLVMDPLVGLDDQMNPYPVLAATIPAPDNSLVQLSGDGADRRLIVTMPCARTSRGAMASRSPPTTSSTPGS